MCSAAERGARVPGCVCQWFVSRRRIQPDEGKRRYPWLTVDEDCWRGGYSHGQEAVLKVVEHPFIKNRISHVAGLKRRRKGGGHKATTSSTVGVPSSCKVFVYLRLQASCKEGLECLRCLRVHRRGCMCSFRFFQVVWGGTYNCLGCCFSDRLVFPFVVEAG